MAATITENIKTIVNQKGFHGISLVYLIGAYRSQFGSFMNSSLSNENQFETLEKMLFDSNLFVVSFPSEMSGIRLFKNKVEFDYYIIRCFVVLDGRFVSVLCFGLCTVQ